MEPFPGAHYSAMRNGVPRFEGVAAGPAGPGGLETGLTEPSRKPCCPGGSASQTDCQGFIHNPYSLGLLLHRTLPSRPPEPGRVNLGCHTSHGERAGAWGSLGIENGQQRPVQTRAASASPLTALSPSSTATPDHHNCTVTITAPP